MDSTEEVDSFEDVDSFEKVEGQNDQPLWPEQLQDATGSIFPPCTICGQSEKKDTNFKVIYCYNYRLDPQSLHHGKQQPVMTWSSQVKSQ